MKINQIHSFDVTYQEAVVIQNSLRKRLRLRDARRPPLKIVAGADISYARNSSLFFAAVVLHSYPEMEILEEAQAVCEASFPYIPGLLTFREGPSLLAAFAKLRLTPDLAIFDGQGIAHPRGMGLASHMGLFLDIPTIGCAKTRLFGTFAAAGVRAGDTAPLMDNDRIIGSVVRTKTGVRPLFISQGQGISLKRAVDVALSCCRGYRLPEPVRQAHIAVNRLRQNHATSPHLACRETA